MAYPKLVTKSQRCAKSCDLYEKQITCFSLKTKYCHVIIECHLKITRAAKITWSESLACSAVILDTPAVYRVKDSSCNGRMLPPKGHEANPTELFGRRAEKYGPAAIREAQIAVSEVLGRLHFNTAAFCGWYEARATGCHLQKRWKNDLVTRRI